VTVSPDRRDAFERIFEGDHISRIGTVREDRGVAFMDGARPLFTVSCDESNQAWQAPLNF